MRIIPPEPATTTQSHGERMLHLALREAAAEPYHWHAVHALAIAEHAHKPTSEADFVLIGTPGIFVLEVKGGTISRRNGIWYSTNLFGVDFPLRQSPFVQAQDAIHAIMRWLTAALPDLPSWGVRFGHGVAFPDCLFPFQDPGWVPAQVLTNDHINTATGVEYFLDDFASYWTGKLPNKAPLSPNHIETIVGLLAGDLGRPAAARPVTAPAPDVPATTFAGQRGELVDFLRADLVGPWLGPDEVLPDSPLRRYVAGVLYPQPEPLASPSGAGDPESAMSAATGDEAGQEDQSEQPIAAAYAQRPASLGVSFVVTGPAAVRVQVQAATYERQTPPRDPAGAGAEPGDDQSFPDLTGDSGWQRRPWREPPTGEGYLLQPGQNQATRLPVLGGRGELTAHWRPLRHGTLVTVSLTNAVQGSTDSALTDPAACLFQVELTCFPAEGSEISAYPRFERLTDDPEERELALLYRREEHYAVGHGTGAQWHHAPEDPARITAVTTATLPAYELPPVTYDLPGMEDTLSFFALSDLSGQTNDDIVIRLRSFAAGYEEWAAGLPAAHVDIPSPLIPTRDLLLARITATADRIAEGIRVLQTTPHAMRAFRLMNEAMLRQRLAGTPAATATDLRPYARWRWRPFQLAFVLLSLPSLTNPDHPDRQLVDLLWFPTGGGKTEAYLGVIGFLLCWRRLAHPARAGGTTAIMRYTLRLLTTQQFLRAAKLICASEFMRREQYHELGDQPITLGLWIGSSLTPNTFSNGRDGAVERLKKVRSGEETGNPFVLDACPWCATPLLPADRTDLAAPIGFLASESGFVVRCPDPGCFFHRELPVQLVDEALYAAPPSLLLATVDKFAMVTWEEQAGVFFGDQRHLPPDLVVQDELHLIAGPLGTMVGLYETAIDGIIAGRGAAAKLIASTATIRGAGPQVHRLYGRPMHVFPPPGLTADDSYFARRDDTRPGRLYLGVMPAGISDATASVRLTAALLQAPMTLPPADREAYWTLVSYHNNLRGVGRGLSLAADEIPLHIEYLARSMLATARAVDPDALAVLAAEHPDLARHLAAGESAGPLSDRELARDIARDISDATAELTSNIKAADLGEMLSRLERPATEPGAISLLLCTNMLSVGVDVARLALLLMHGQPKSTAEYIQATSRVGRGEVPGLVVCLYSSLRPRDRSHYEHFAGFHAAFYREVEATPVTPFAAPARERALPAVLVSLARHRAGVEQAYQFDAANDDVADVIALIAERVAETDPAEAEATAAQLAELVADWSTQTRLPGQLRFGTAADVLGPPVAIPTLLAAPEDVDAKGWATPMSMRTVEGSVPLRIIRSGE